MATAPVLSIELFYDGVWNIVTGDVYEGSLVITRGRSSVDQQAASQSLTCVFKNDDGKYSPRNASSQLFGKIGRNTPIRATVSGSPRFYGEVASWAPSWNENHTVKTVEIAANGVLRRMGQGSTPAANPLGDFVLSQFTTLTSYFPLSSPEGTLYSINLGRVGTNVNRFFKEGAPIVKYGASLGADWLGTGLEITGTGSSFLRADVNSTDDNFAIDFVFQSKAMGVLQVRVFDQYGNYWNLKLQNASNTGTVQVSYFDAQTGTGSYDQTASAPIPALVGNSDFHTCRFQVQTVAGPDMNYFVYFDGNTTPISAGNGNLGIGRGWSATTLYRLLYGRDNAAQDVANVGHLALWSVPGGSVPGVDLYDQAARGYIGETAADRISRIAALAGTTATIVGAAAASTAMGAQVAETRLQQLRDAEATDFGILTESRAAFALRYRTRASMYNQSPVATLDYVGRQVAPPFQPVDDDQQTRNDVTVSRRGGGDYRLVKTSGALSKQAPPNGVGPYEDSVTINIVSDDGLPAAAAWWLYQGTIDEPRFPQIAVNLTVADINDAKAATLRALDIGDALQVANLAGTDITTDVMVIVLGYTETIKDDLQHQITFNCATATGYTFAKWGSAAGSGPDRWDTEYSTLTAGIDASATSFQVTSPATALWTTNGAEFPFDINIAGERMTVYNITGATSPQTFGPVARSQNGVAKAQASGAAVRLWKTPRYGY